MEQYIIEIRRKREKEIRIKIFTERVYTILKIEIGGWNETIRLEEN